LLEELRTPGAEREFAVRDIDALLATRRRPASVMKRSRAAWKKSVAQRDRIARGPT
jgi:hypothetical protein